MSSTFPTGGPEALGERLPAEAFNKQQPNEQRGAQSSDTAEQRLFGVPTWVLATRLQNELRRRCGTRL